MTFIGGFAAWAKALQTCSTAHKISVSNHTLEQRQEWNMSGHRKRMYPRGAFIKSSSLFIKPEKNEFKSKTDKLMNNI